MADSSLFSGLANTKARTFVILFGAIIAVGVGIAIFRGNKDTQDSLAKQSSQTVAVPSSIKATPGNVVPEKYRELQMQENERRAQEALEKKTSAIPTIIGAVGDPASKENADAAALEAALKGQDQKLQVGMEGVGFTNTNVFAKSPQEKAREDQEARLKEQRDRLEKMRLDKEKQAELERQNRLAEQQKREYQEAVNKIQTNMKNYAQGAHAEWSKFTPQQYVQGYYADKTRPKPGEKGAQGEGSQSGTTVEGVGQGGSRERAITPSGGIFSLPGDVRSRKQRVYVKAGTIMYGVLETSVNSDEPGPVLASIVSGKYAGSRLIGAFKHQGQQESIIISFDKMAVPKRTKSLDVDVVAIDTETARTALASDVDKHYLLRYGSLFASSLMAGYAKAISNEGTTTVSPLTGTTTTTTPPLDNKEKLLVALGQVGTEWGNQTKALFTTPYTVTVDKGTSVGLLFLSDVEVSDDSEGKTNGRRE